jgi:SAM-dependent methyltransferase
MIRAAGFSSRPPWCSLAAIYAISVPFALVITPPGMAWDTVAAGCAVSLSWIIGLAPWWLLINAVFLPWLVWGLPIENAAAWAFAALATLLLVYGRVWNSRAPIFFTSPKSQEALSALLPVSSASFLDVGCGDGRVIAKLAAVRPDCQFTGIEQAFLPWLLARLRCQASDGLCSVIRGNLLDHDLSSYDVVYAYLSPAVMTKLWHKARREMRPGALLISVFDIHGSGEHDRIEIDDSMQTQLHVWSIGARSAT